MRTHLVAAAERGTKRTGFIDRTGAITPTSGRARLLDEVSAVRWAELLTRRDLGWVFTSIPAPEEMVVAANADTHPGDTP